MTHKKYIKIGGKTYGPYYYESYREDGKVKKRYVRDFHEDSVTKKTGFFYKSLIVFLGVFLVFTLLFLGGFFSNSLTGRAIIQIQEDLNSESQFLEGNLALSVFGGELLPSDSIIRLNLGSQSADRSLSELIQNQTRGDYYLEGFNISGSGDGYGFLGESISSSDISFELEVFLIDESSLDNSNDGNDSEQTNSSDDEDLESSEEDLNDSETGDENISENFDEVTIPDSEDVVQEELVEESIDEQNIENPDELTEEISEEIDSSNSEITGDSSDESVDDSASSEEDSSSDKPSISSNLITGAVISDRLNIISGIVSSKENFSLSLDSGYSARIVQGSVRISDEVLNDEIISIRIYGSNVIISTDYVLTREGFGNDFISEKEFLFNITLSSFGLLREDGVLTAILEYDNMTLIETEKEISSEFINETPEEIFPLLNQTNETKDALPVLLSNIPDITISLNSNVSIDLDDYFSNNPIYLVDFDSKIDFSLDGSTLTIFSGNESYQTLARIFARYLINGSEKTLSSNNFLVSFVKENYSFSLVQHRAVIGRPVRWTKTVQKLENETISVELPKYSINISVKKIESSDSTDSVRKDVDKRRMRITGAVIGEGSSGSFLSRLFGFFGITGFVVSEEVFENDSVIIEIEDNSTLIEIEYETEAPQAREELTTSGKRIIVSGPSELGYTDILAYSYIDDLDKKISVESARSISLYWHASYENALKYGYISNESASSSSEDNSILNESLNYSLDNNSLELTPEETVSVNLTIEELNESPIESFNLTDKELKDLEKDEKKENNTLLKDTKDEEKMKSLISGNVVSDLALANETNYSDNSVVVSIEFNYSDVDGDGFIDYIEWIVPHLSEQVYDLIIEIESAEHLDENKTFVADVYSLVSEKDDVWFAVPNEHYLRVSFEKELDSTRDITLYARPFCNESILINETLVPCEIYFKKLELDMLRREE